MRHGPRCSSRAFLTSRFVGTSELVWTWSGACLPAATSELYNTYFLRMIYLHSSHNLDVATAVNMDWRWIFWRCIYILSLDDLIAASWFIPFILLRDCASVFSIISDHLRRFQERGAWQNAIDLLYGFQHTVQEITRDQEVRNCCRTIGACERGRLGGLVVDMYRLQRAWAIKKSLDALNRVVHSVFTYVVAWFECGHCGVSFRFRIRGKHGMVQIHADTTHSDGNHVQHQDICMILT